MIRVVDADVHIPTPPIDALLPYLSDHWREYIAHSGFKGVIETSYPRAPTSVRPGARLTTGSIEGDLAVLREQVLAPFATDIAILNCAYAIESIHNPDLDIAMASAVNDWQIHHWLSADARLRGSILVPIRQPQQAAREIERVGGHPGFVQVVIPARSQIPYGKRHYHPLFAAAAKHDLVVGIAFGGLTGAPSTSSGWPSYYIEEYVGMAAVFQSQLMSMIVEGTFDQFPTLRVAFLESGFTWLPPFLWRFDKEWKGLRREVPWNDRVPSHYVRDHLRLTLQPNDGPTDAARVARAIDQLGSEDMLMFSTDYPHWHFDSAAEAMPSGLSEALRARIMGANARAFYRLEGSR